MILDELTVARIARYGVEINLARAEMAAARAALRAAQQAEVDALEAYCALHEKHGLDPDQVTVLVRDVNGPLGKFVAGTVITKPDALGQGGGLPYEPPPPPPVVLTPEQEASAKAAVDKAIADAKPKSNGVVQQPIDASAS